MAETIEITPLSITILSSICTLIGVLAGYSWGLANEIQRECKEWREREKERHS